jgi:hypothetical protein
MLHLPDHWRRYAWVLVSAALAGVSYWMFFRGGSGSHSLHKPSPVARREMRQSGPSTRTASPLIDTGRHE